MASRSPRHLILFEVDAERTPPSWSRDLQVVAAPPVEVAGDDPEVEASVPPAVRTQTPARAGSPPRPRSTGVASAATLFSSGENRAPLVAAQLFESAPETSARFAGRAVRGRWIPIDPVDRSRGSLLFGVLAAPLSTEEGWAVASRLRDRHREPAAGQDDPFADGDLAIAVRDRLLVAVVRRRRGQPWDMLAD